MTRADEARAEACRAHRWQRVWWSLAPLSCGGYVWVSDAAWPERLMLAFVAGATVAGNAIGYASEARAAESKAAGYENP